MALLADICSRHSRHLTLYVSGHCGRNAPEFIKSSFTLERATTVFWQNSSERKHGYFLCVCIYNLVFPMCIYSIYISIGVFFSSLSLFLVSTQQKCWIVFFTVPGHRAEVYVNPRVLQL